MNSLFHIDIPKRTTQCAHQGEQLLPGMDIYSFVYEDRETKRTARKDVCANCWPHFRQKEGEHPLSKGFWKSKIEKRKAVESSTRAVRALSLLRELLQSPSPLEEEIFVLCLYLAHARQIALRQEFQKESGTFFLYEVSRTEEFFTVKAMTLSSTQVASIQKSLAIMLGAEH